MTSAAPNENEQERAHAARLYDLFRGADARHGTYDVKRLRLVGSKMEMKDENGKGPLDVKGPPTPDLWVKHLAGVRPLGVCPLREDGMCRWGVIDIDVYDGLSHGDLAAAIARRGLPLVICVSKSKGAHLYLFADDWVHQTDMNGALVSVAAHLGHADAETYPPATGLGNWMNMPYLGDSDRCGVKAGGLEMTVAEFIAAAESARCSGADLIRLARSAEPGKSATSAAATGENADRAARKLGTLVAEIADAPEGGRAKLLYGRAKDMGRMIGAGRIDENLVIGELTVAALACGLSAGEAISHIRRGIEHGKTEPPDDGGDGDDRYPDLSKIIVLTGGEEELWRVTVANHGDITLPVKDVTNYYTFNLRCAEKLRKYFRHMKVDAWNDRIDAALVRAEFEAIPPDETVDGMMREQLRAFCMDKYRGDRIDELLLGKPIHVDDEDRIYFRFEDFEKFLRTGSSRFKNETRQRLGVLIREAVGKDNYRQTMKVVMGHPKGMPVRWIRRSVFGQSVDLPLPRIEPPPL